MKTQQKQKQVGSAQLKIIRSKAKDQIEACIKRQRAQAAKRLGKKPTPQLDGRFLANKLDTGGGFTGALCKALAAGKTSRNHKYYPPEFNLFAGPFVAKTLGIVLPSHAWQLAADKLDAELVQTQHRLEQAVEQAIEDSIMASCGAQELLERIKKLPAA